MQRSKPLPNDLLWYAESLVVMISSVVILIEPIIGPFVGRVGSVFALTIACVPSCSAPECPTPFYNACQIGNEIAVLQPIRYPAPGR